MVTPRAGFFSLRRALPASPCLAAVGRRGAPVAPPMAPSAPASRSPPVAVAMGLCRKLAAYRVISTGYATLWCRTA